MIWLVLSMTVGQLARQRRTLLLLVLAAIPPALAILFRATGQPAEESTDFAVVLLANLLVALVLPLTALVAGTAALGQELEDGTVVYLIAKPVPRWKVVLGKVGAAWIVTVAATVASVLGTGLLMLWGSDDIGLLPAFAVAIVLGALAYSVLFVSLSVRFGRALIFGLVYVFVWETLISQLVVGVRLLSLRAYTTSVADALFEPSADLFELSLRLPTALGMLTLVTLAFMAYAIRRLNRYELSERV